MKGFRSIPKAKDMTVSEEIDIICGVHFIYCKISEEQRNFLVFPMAQNCDSFYKVSSELWTHSIKHFAI